MRRLITITGENAPLKTNAEYHKLICRQFYRKMKNDGKKKKVSGGVAKILKKNSIPETLALMGARKAGSALAAKEKANKKAAADVAAKDMAVKNAKRKAAAVINSAVAAAARARALKKEAAAAKTKAIVVRKSPARGTKRKAKSPSQTAQSTATKKSTATSAAKRKADKTRCKLTRPEPNRNLRLQARLLSRPKKQRLR